MHELRQRLLRLAHSEPETRGALLPILRGSDTKPPSREEAEAVADLFLAALRKVPVGSKTAKQTTAPKARQELLRHPKAVKQQMVKLIQKNPSVWGAIKKLLRREPLNTVEKTKLKSLLGAVTTSGLSILGLYYAIPLTSALIRNWGVGDPDAIAGEDFRENVLRQMKREQVQLFETSTLSQGLGSDPVLLPGSRLRPYLDHVEPEPGASMTQIPGV